MLQKHGCSVNETALFADTINEGSKTAALCEPTTSLIHSTVALSLSLTYTQFN